MEIIYEPKEPEPRPWTWLWLILPLAVWLAACVWLGWKRVLLTQLAGSLVILAFCAFAAFMGRKKRQYLPPHRRYRP